MSDAPGGALKAELVRAARGLGFARAGVAAVTDLGRDGDALRRWVADGHHASMAWMADTLEVRLDPAHARMLAGAKSVLVLAAPYRRPDEGGGPAPGVVARYARGRDYHNVLQKRSRKLAKQLRDAGHQARVSVDAMPVLERAWAQRAGVGFIGKNCCLIVPGLGSHLFLGRQLPAVPRWLPDRRLRRGADPRREPLPLLPDHRASRPDRRALAGATRGAPVRL